MNKIISNLKFFLFYFILFFNFCNYSYSTNVYKYPDFNVTREDCMNILENLNFPNPDYTKKKPTIIYVDLLIEKIFKIDGKDMEFEAFYSLWFDWQEDRLAEVLKKLNLFNDDGKRTYLCSYNPMELWGKENRLFNPTIEFYNKKTKTDINQGRDVDWVDIYSDGNVGTRLRDSSFFSAKFDFRKFPFDNQKIVFELWSEYPSTQVKIYPEPISMTQYKETNYTIDGIPVQIPGWKINKTDYYDYSYVDNDNLPYQGFYLEIFIEREYSYYIFKIILPIIFLLTISWSVFWIRGSQLEAKVNVTIVCLLSLIAYNFIIDEDIPKLSYLTFMDTFILLSYFYTGIATILCVYSFLRKIKTGKDLSVVDRYAQFIGPISYFGFLIISLIYYYNLEGLGALLKGLLLGPQFN